MKRNQFKTLELIIKKENYLKRKLKYQKGEWGTTNRRKNDWYRRINENIRIENKLIAEKVGKEKLLTVSLIGNFII